MKISWKLNGKMTCSVYRKENQLLKYLNNSSCHTHSTFRAIPAGVFKRLSRLTSKEAETSSKKIDQLHPDHIKALRTAKLLPEEIPTFGELWENDERETIVTEEKRRDTRNIYFCIGYSNFWVKPIHKVINDLIKKSPQLRWIRVRMSHHRFPNPSELFYGDLASKIRKDICS